ncbi:hypothetical protein Syun_012596 [Stephania yunnanensis]|uniref:BAG domain-containing protein n=1 Tax=Stephania yunnanensis TaxID=152371 RepID=A0AAP0JZQ4_9MAGN
MSGFRRIDIIEPSSTFLCFRETSIFNPSKALTFPSFPFMDDNDDLDFAFDLLNPNPAFDLYTTTMTKSLLLSPPTPDPLRLLDSFTDLIQIDGYKRIHERNTTDLCLRSLADRVAALELGLGRVVDAKKVREQDRKYSWTAEIKSGEKDGLDRKYKWIAEVKGAKKKKSDVEKSYKWIAEFKGKGKDSPISRTYTFKASTAPPRVEDQASKDSAKKDEKEKKKTKKKSCDGTRVVCIEEAENNNQGALFLRQAFAKRAGAASKGKGKRKELSPQDAAMMIQATFKAFLIRRSQALRALRELAMAKAKLKELRALFQNFSYRRQIARDAEERQRFSEKIIVLLLTVDAIEGADVMVRSAKKSMVDELEAMLDIVDPQQPGKLGWMKRRKFDLPEGGVQPELAAGVAEVVQMLDEDKSTFEVSL